MTTTATATRSTTAFAVGDYVQERLWTDTLIYKVIRTTPRTLTLARTSPTGEVLHKEHRDNPIPVVWEAVEDTAETLTLRLRKDGTFRVGTSGNPLHPATTVDGRPARYVDYRL